MEAGRRTAALSVFGQNDMCQVLLRAFQMSHGHSSIPLQKTNRSIPLQTAYSSIPLQTTDSSSPLQTVAGSSDSLFCG
jgi:hypothetical protein